MQHLVHVPLQKQKQIVISVFLTLSILKTQLICCLTLIRLTFERLARTGWWWLSPPPEKSVITQLILLIFGHVIPQMKIYIFLDPQCTAAVLPDSFSVSKRSQKYLKIAKSHSFIYFLTISMKSSNFSIFGLYIHKMHKKES